MVVVHQVEGEKSGRQTGAGLSWPENTERRGQMVDCVSEFTCSQR